MFQRDTSVRLALDPEFETPSHPMPDETAISNIHSQIGTAGFERLVAAFYRRIPTDDIVHWDTW